MGSCTMYLESASVCVSFPGFLSRRPFKIGVYSRQAFITCTLGQSVSQHLTACSLKPLSSSRHH